MGFYKKVRKYFKTHLKIVFVLRTDSIVTFEITMFVQKPSHLCFVKETRIKFILYEKRVYLVYLLKVVSIRV